jgi:pyridinium-3,5-bisthiocarboxylic acid mononucleotide nickel chelatase
MNRGFSHIHLDAVGGIAGDMFVAAMLDALPDLRARVLADVAAVLPKKTGHAVLQERQAGAIRALHFSLAAPKSKHPAHAHDSDHGHEHAHDHDHDQDHAHHDAGSFTKMVDRIRKAGLHEGTAEHAVGILTQIAAAEARIHDVPIDKVHFHEIADWDSLMDVVAAGSIAAALPGAVWSVSDLPRGAGLVQTRHGLLPVPPPATAMMLEDFVWRDDGVAGERVTPTGAAILRHLIPACAQHARVAGRLVASGAGAGTRELSGIPNILRALVFEREAAASSLAPSTDDSVANETEQVAVLTFDIDDMTGEEIGAASERLRAEAGVLDVSVSTRIGKKGRPLHDFRLLVQPALLEHIKLQVLNETSTIGLRWRFEDRMVLPRQVRKEAVREGVVRVKEVMRPDGTHSVKAESDDLQAFASLARRRAAKAEAEGGPDA